MFVNKDNLVLRKTEYGFYQYSPLPFQEDLNTYYRDKYYQEGKGSYEIVYTDKEVAYSRLRASLIYKKVAWLLQDVSFESVLDVGCGEGWLLQKFWENGHKVCGLDFSLFGLIKFHPHLKDKFIQGDIYQSLNKIISSGRKYEVVILANVIEHVLDPVSLVEGLRKILSDSGVMVICAPNDFSKLHEHLLENGFIEEEFWLSYPEHLSYFNKESMTSLLSDKGFVVRSVIGDNPIDMNLMNANSNYARNREKGKATHFFRVETDTFLAKIDEEKLLNLYEVYGSMGVGRNLIYFSSVRK